MLAILKSSGAKIVFAPFYDNVDQEYEDVKIFEHGLQMTDFSHR